MGINTLTQSTATGQVQLVASSTIAAGDLIVNYESGGAYPASTALSLRQNYNNDAGASPSILPYAALNSTYYGYYQNPFLPCSLQLSTGTIVNVYSGNGTSNAATNLNISFTNLKGETIYAPIVISGSSIGGIRVRRIGTTGFVVCWLAGTSLRFAIYNNDSTEVLTSTIVATLGSSQDAPLFDMNVIASGDIVIAYRKTGNSCSFTRYNSSGTIQGSEVLVESSSTPSSIKIITLAAGGFWIYYRKTSTTAATKIGRYNSTGTLQGSLITVAGSGASELSNNPDNLGFELSNGNVVVFYGSDNTTVGTPAFSIYTSSGTAIGDPTEIYPNSTYNNPYYLPAICITTTGFYVVTKGTNTYSYLFFYNNSGLKIINFRKINVAILDGSPMQSGLLFNLNNAGLALVINTNDTTYDNLFVFCFDPLTGAVIGTNNNLTNNAYTAIGSISCFLTNEQALNITLATFNSSSISQPFSTVCYVMKKSIIGVAQEAIATNSTGRVATNGTYIINQSFNVGGQFDNRTYDTVGTKGSITSSTAVLYGMS